MYVLWRYIYIYRICVGGENMKRLSNCELADRYKEKSELLGGVGVRN